MDSKDFEQTDREMLAKLGRTPGRDLCTRIYEPKDYENFAQAVYQASRKGSTAHRLGASLTARDLAEQFSWDYEGFDAAAFMVSCRAGKRYVPLVPDESDERARAEVDSVANTDYDDYERGRIELIEVGKHKIFRYTGAGRGSEPEPVLPPCETAE